MNFIVCKLFLIELFKSKTTVLWKKYEKTPISYHPSKVYQVISWGAIKGFINLPFKNSWSGSWFKDHQCLPKPFGDIVGEQDIYKNNPTNCWLHLLGKMCLSCGIHACHQTSQHQQWTTWHCEFLDVYIPVNVLAQIAWLESKPRPHLNLIFNLWEIWGIEEQV